MRSLGMVLSPFQGNSLFRTRTNFVTDASLFLYSFWSKVNPRTHTPINSVWLVVFCCTCLNLIGIGSQQTIVAIFNITAPALDLSYVAVIFARMIYSQDIEFIEGPFTLGKWGTPLNCIAICWVLFISVILFFPPIKPITSVNMYAARLGPCFWNS